MHKVRNPVPIEIDGLGVSLRPRRILRWCREGRMAKNENKILSMSRPVAETLDFWRATANTYNEYIARISKFSRSLGNVRPCCQLARHTRLIPRAPSVRSVKKESLGKLFVMPDPVTRHAVPAGNGSESRKSGKEGL